MGIIKQYKPKDKNVTKLNQYITKAKKDKSNKLKKEAL